MNKKNNITAPKFDPDELYFIPLGGSEQFGVNLNLYHYSGRWLAVDCGIGFADHRFPGVDILLPDPSFIADQREDLDGLIITHAHEDHIGAVPYLWPRLRCPIYCTSFTAAVLRNKFQEFKECQDAEIHIVAPGDIVEIGPYRVRFIHTAHSIPEACALEIETDAGRILHSGDWNLDPAPVIGKQTDEATFREVGQKGVLAYIGDSTNAGVAGRSGSEADVGLGLEKVFAECRGRICITMFASNVGRVCSIAKAAKATGRRVALVGRSLHTMTSAARSCGYLDDITDFLSDEDIGYLPDDKQVLIVTGSQGEPRAALARMARGEHPFVSLKRGDTVIFSARPIPGNEKDIDAVKNNLSAAGVRIITDGDAGHTIHVSGHPRSEEIVEMLGWLKPDLVVPVHGERMQLEAHADLARACQIKNVIVPNNGSVICLGPGKPGTVDHVSTGLLAVEPNRIIRADHQAISSRRKLQYTGAVHVTLVISERGDLMIDPQISSIGLVEPDSKDQQQLEQDLGDEIEDILVDIDRDDLHDDRLVTEEVRIGIRRYMHELFGMKPNTSVHIVRVEG